jgi:hypothetical protein
MNTIQKPTGAIRVIDFRSVLDVELMALELKKAYSDIYAWDEYLFRQNQINFLKNNVPEETFNSFGKSFWLDFYLGKVYDSKLSIMLESMDEGNFKNYKNIKPNRKRLVSEFIVEFDKVSNSWNTRRIKHNSFKQEKAKINKDEIDYRHVKRYFKELPDYLCSKDLLSGIEYVSSILHNTLPRKPKKFNIVVHHTIVYAYPDIVSTNSPEGIHQDGMDYIVSAMVVEKFNINGAESIIFGSDVHTELMTINLEQGFGILQPDKDSGLWHTVQPIFQKNKHEIGYRSTIGFDITLM